MSKRVKADKREKVKELDIIEDHIVRWSLERPYRPAWELAEELWEALTSVNPQEGERRGCACL